VSIDAVDKAADVDRAAPPDQRQHIARLAQEFESLLMTQMLREMRRSMLEDDSQERGLGLGAMTDTLDIALGQALSRVGGFGLSAALGTALGRSVTHAAAKDSSTAASDGVVVPSSPGHAVITDEEAARPSETDLKLPGGTITSGFGWRRDPFNGAIKFHKGIDVAQPYGQDVRAAASGQVVASGDQGSYGTTVVVDHGGGQRTRYAHLSALSVQVGEHVESGQVIGKVGDTGRTTGPHLHFEVLDNGRVVDPTGS
jgi:murein DD-endopeptidase MepM/ murein hydrolase activator NlpD